MGFKDEHVEKGKRAAELVLKDNFIDCPPILTHELAENYGLTVYIASFKENDIAGYLDFDKRWIVVNKEDSLPRQNFTIAHELGHWIMHPDQVKSEEDIRIVYRRPVSGETDPLEIEANAFAAHLLVPDEILRKFQNKTTLELANLFNVSQSMMGFRKANLHA